MCFLVVFENDKSNFFVIKKPFDRNTEGLIINKQTKHLLNQHKINFIIGARICAYKNLKSTRFSYKL